MDDLLLKQRIAVEAVNDQVELTLGNSAIRFDYTTALKLSNWLRVRGKEAKKNAGDISRHWHAIAILSDAEENDKANLRNIIP